MQPSSTPAGTSLDLVDLALGASGPVKAVLLALGIASLLVWFIFFLKLTQLAGLRRKNLAFEREASTAELTSDLLVVARRHPEPHPSVARLHHLHAQVPPEGVVASPGAHALQQVVGHGLPRGMSGSTASSRVSRGRPLKGSRRTGQLSRSHMRQ